VNGTKLGTLHKARTYDVDSASCLCTSLSDVGEMLYRSLPLRPPNFACTMSGPVASNLVLLGELERSHPGTKVRFLGWCVSLFYVNARVCMWLMAIQCGRLCYSNGDSPPEA
jgi:hypothetical protein